MSRASPRVLAEADLRDRLDERAHQLRRQRRTRVDRAGARCAARCSPARSRSSASSIRRAMSGCDAAASSAGQRASSGTQNTFSADVLVAVLEDLCAAARAPRCSRRWLGSESSASSSWRRCSNASEMYFRNSRPEHEVLVLGRLDRAAQLVRRLEQRRAVRAVCRIRAHSTRTVAREAACVTRWARESIGARINVCGVHRC